MIIIDGAFLILVWTVDLWKLRFRVSLSVHQVFARLANLVLADWLIGQCVHGSP